MRKDKELRRQACLIDGAWTGAADGAVINVDNPATGERLGTVPKCGRGETARAIAAANATTYGLAAYLYTRDLGRAFRVSEALEYGVVGVNESAISNTEAPFGGGKESGIGREGSRYGIEKYSVMKDTCIGGLAG